VFQAFVLKTAVNDAICATLPLGSGGDEAEPNEQGERLMWHEVAMADRLGAIRGPGESYSGAILRLVGIESACAP
jgi:hypothetical protein